jgi:hypothetical protein
MIMANPGEGEPNLGQERILTDGHRDRFARLASLSGESGKGLPYNQPVEQLRLELSKSTLIPRGFGSATELSVFATEFFFRDRDIARHERPEVLEALRAKEPTFKNLNDEEKRKYALALTDTEFDEKFRVVEELIDDFYGTTYDTNLGHV